MPESDDEEKYLPDAQGAIAFGSDQKLARRLSDQSGGPAVPGMIWGRLRPHV